MHSMLNRKIKSKQKSASNTIHYHHSKFKSTLDNNFLAGKTPTPQNSKPFCNNICNSLYVLDGISSLSKFDHFQEGIQDSFTRAKYLKSRKKNKGSLQFEQNRNISIYKSSYCPIGVVRQAACQSIQKENTKYGSLYFTPIKSPTLNGYERKTKVVKTFYYFPKTNPLEDPVTLQLSIDPKSDNRAKNTNKYSKIRRTCQIKSSVNQNENVLQVKGTKSQWEIFRLQLPHHKNKQISQTGQKKNRVVIPQCRYVFQ